MREIPFAAARTWLFDRALPFWAAHGVDETHGGFHEALTLAGAPLDVGFKRVRVIARQTYVFAHAALMGWDGPARALAERGGAELVARAWSPTRGHFVRTLTTAGAARDETPDLYDHAFVLFAFGWLHAATGAQHWLDWALRTVDAIETHFAASEGFAHVAPDDGARLQNPHMHLLEAALVCLEHTRHPRFEALTQRIVALFAGRLFDPGTGTLAEYFDADWARAAGERGRIVEPGHHFEWAWILGQARRIARLDQSAAALRLVAFAERFGCDEASGATFNSVRDDGAPLDRGSRTWPNTERIKGAIAAFELGGVDPRPALAAAGNALLDRYLTPDGGWIDSYDAAVQPTATTMPASTFYHVALALAELLRVEAAVRAL